MHNLYSHEDTVWTSVTYVTIHLSEYAMLGWKEFIYVYALGLMLCCECIYSSFISKRLYTVPIRWCFRGSIIKCNKTLQSDGSFLTLGRVVWQNYFILTRNLSCHGDGLNGLLWTKYGSLVKQSVVTISFSESSHGVPYFGHVMTISNHHDGWVRNLRLKVLTSF